MKLDFDGLIGHNIPLKDVTKFYILNIMNIEPRKNRKFCDNLKKKDTKKKDYIDNDVHAKIDPKLQSISKIQIPRIIINEGIQGKYSMGFCRVSEKPH